jgi:hypothetical protein
VQKIPWWGWLMIGVFGYQVLQRKQAPQPFAGNAYQGGAYAGPSQDPNFYQGVPPDMGGGMPPGSMPPY